MRYGAALGTDGNAHFTFVFPYTTLVGAYQRLPADGNADGCPLKDASR